MQKPWLDNPDVKRLDPIWTQVRREAEETSTREPVLASLIYATILSEPTDEDYGQREYGLRDVEGHDWYIATPFAPPAS